MTGICAWMLYWRGGTSAAKLKSAPGLLLLGVVLLPCSGSLNAARASFEMGGSKCRAARATCIIMIKSMCGT